MVEKFELALQEFYPALDECRQLCIGPLRHTKTLDFAQAIARSCLSLILVEVKRSCEHKEFSDGLNVTAAATVCTQSQKCRIPATSGQWVWLVQGLEEGSCIWNQQKLTVRKCCCCTSARLVRQQLYRR